MNGDGKIDAANDRTVIGQNFPSWTGGLSINLFWKDFDFSALFQGAFDVDKYCEAESSYAFYNGGKVLKNTWIVGHRKTTTQAIHVLQKIHRPTS